VRQALGQSSLPVLVGDSNDPEFLASMARRTAVVCTTVGPYALYGENLVAACAKAGTSYCDLTGETQFVRRMIDRYEEAARQSGARIVHCCGFDSIPSDLGVHFLQEQAKLRFGGPCEHVRTGVLKMRGGASGGTLASISALIEEARKDRSITKLLGDPYGLNPSDQRSGPDGRDQTLPVRDPDFGWTAPFVMAAINTRVVRRTNAVLNYPYGRDFRYDEFTVTGPSLKGLATGGAVAAGIVGMMATLALPPLAKVAQRFMPKPGEGPTPAQRAAGSFLFELLGTRAQDGGRIKVRVSANSDPGYGATSLMLAEAALCLAQDAARLPVQGGSWTPAAAMGTALTARLNEVGVRFSLAG
jgi:short subunit dehydrogenase-like uncharacterized protein